MDDKQFDENQKMYEDLMGYKGENVVEQKKPMDGGDKFILAMFLLILLGMLVIGYFCIRSFFDVPSVRNDQMVTSTSTTTISTTINEYSE